MESHKKKLKKLQDSSLFEKPYNLNKYASEDSLSKFQRSLTKRNNTSEGKLSPYRNAVSYKMKVKTQFIPEALEEEIMEIRKKAQIKKQYRKVESKLDQLLNQIQLMNNRNQETQIKRPSEAFNKKIYFGKPQFGSSPFYAANRPLDDNPQMRSYRKRVIKYENYKEKLGFMKKRKNQRKSIDERNQRKKYIRSKFRKVVYAVIFPMFLKNQATKLAKQRKKNLQIFWKYKFEPQMQKLRDWLLESHKKQLLIILEKGELDFRFFLKEKAKVKQQTEKTVLRLVNMGLKPLQQSCTQEKVTPFLELFEQLCQRKSFAIHGFWTFEELKYIPISNVLGDFKIDHKKQKYLIGLVVFIKMLIFNLYLQPMKFDAFNFSKNKGSLMINMKLFASVYYCLAKEVIMDYLQSYQVPEDAKQNMKKFCQLDESLTIGEGQIQESEFISGLYTSKQLQILTTYKGWFHFKKIIRNIIEKLYTLMKNKSEENIFDK